MRFSRIRGRRLIEHIQELGFSVIDHGDVDIVHPLAPARQGDPAKYLPEVVRSTQNIFSKVSSLLEAEETPVILGGDHTVAIGTFSAVAANGRQTGNEVGLIWFDAHADINTPETSASGNIHGMPLGAILGSGNHQLVNLNGFAPKLKPEFLAHIGARDVDAGERQQIRELGLRDNFFTMSD